MEHINMSSISVRANHSSDALHSLQDLKALLFPVSISVSDQYLTSSFSAAPTVNRPDKMDQQKFEALGDELQRSIGGLNSEFNRNHRPLSDKIKELNNITDELESMHKTTTKGSLIGATMGAAGGITALALAPFTFGFSLVAAVGVGVVGGLVGATSNIINMWKQSNLRETIENIVNDFQNRINPMIQHLNTISNTIEELQKMEQKYSVQNKAIITGVKALRTASKMSKLLTVLRTTKIGKVAARAAKTLKVAGNLTRTITTLFVVLDVYTIYCNSTELSEMKESAGKRKAEEVKSETVKFILQMRETADQFQETLDEIKSARDTINSQLQII